MTIIDSEIVIDTAPYKENNHVRIKEHTGKYSSCGYGIGVIVHLAGKTDKDIIECLKCKSQEPILESFTELSIYK